MECSLYQGCCHHQQWFLGDGDHICHQKWGSNFDPKPIMVNLKIQHHQPFFLPPNLSGKMEALNICIPIPNWRRSIPFFATFSNLHIPLWNKTQHLQNMHEKCVNISYTIISLEFLFGFHYQHQVIELMIFRTVEILIPDRFTLENEPWNIDHNPPLPKTMCLCHSVNFVISSQQYIIVLRWV